jgi:hypothetical protein
LTSALNGGEQSGSRPGRFAPRERAPGTHWIGGWVGPKTVLKAVSKRKIKTSEESSTKKTAENQVARLFCNALQDAICIRDVNKKEEVEISLWFRTSVIV